jgi:ABC-type proline/glycine betaine transport system permease subunit
MAVAVTVGLTARRLRAGIAVIIDAVAEFLGAWEDGVRRVVAVTVAVPMAVAVGVDLGHVAVTIVIQTVAELWRTGIDRPG